MFHRYDQIAGMIEIEFSSNFFFYVARLQVRKRVKILAHIFNLPEILPTKNSSA